MYRGLPPVLVEEDARRAPRTNRNESRVPRTLMLACFATSRSFLPVFFFHSPFPNVASEHLICVRCVACASGRVSQCLLAREVFVSGSVDTAPGVCVCGRGGGLHVMELRNLDFVYWNVVVSPDPAPLQRGRALPRPPKAVDDRLVR